tara:strand:+ start:657 stop:860 length:204 start_codon:yes stop_codon:yes gene_type:complete
MKLDKNGRCKKHDWLFSHSYGVPPDKEAEVYRCLNGCKRKKTVVFYDDFRRSGAPKITITGGRSIID